jgi:hypothetical protein
MITISIALAVGVGIFVGIWRYVEKATVSKWGSDAPMTFTPLDYRPALDETGNFQWDPDGHIMSVPTGAVVPFEPRHERYMKIAEVVTALAAASMVFVPSSRLSAYPRSCAFALILLGFSVLYSVGFMATLTYFYEDFLYNQSSYSPRKYGLVHALGFGGLVCFAVAYFSIAVRVGWALVYATAHASSPKILP